MSIAEQFEQKIKTGELATQLPRSLFVLRRIALWVLFAIVVILGAISAGVAVWFILDPVDLVMDAESFKFLGHLLDALPLFWVGVSLACGLVAVWVFSKSKRGYRYQVLAVGGACLVAFLALGAALASSGLADKIDAITAIIMPQYDSIARPRMMRFMQPGQGMVIGRITMVGTSTFELGDPWGEDWYVQITDQTHMPPRLPLQPGNCISVLGYVSTDTKVAQALIVRPCPRGARPDLPPPPPPMK